jgi:NAD(P)-dependent dehydrogenase (short-subunit alcohol dehydrogenase family)
MELNFIGALRVVKAVLPGMRGRGRGRIVPVSSLLGRVPMPMVGGYAATRSALETAGEILALELADTALRKPGRARSGVHRRPRKDPPVSQSAKLRARRAGGGARCPTPGSSAPRTSRSPSPIRWNTPTLDCESPSASAITRIAAAHRAPWTCHSTPSGTEPTSTAAIGALLERKDGLGNRRPLVRRPGWDLDRPMRPGAA